MQPAPEPRVDRLPEQIAAALDSVSDACALFDREGRFTFVNRSAEKLCRRSRSELLGRTVTEVFPFLAGTALLQAIASAAEQRETVRFDQFYPDAGVWLEGEVHATAAGATVFLRDVAERRHAAKELHRRDETLRGITDQLPVIISQADQDLRIRLVNKAYDNFIGRRGDDEVGKHLSEVAGEPHFSIARPYAQRALGGESVSFESRILHKDGTLHDVQAMYSPLRKADGSPDGYLALILDINDRKKLERERERLLRELSTERARLSAIFDSFPAGVAFAEAPSGAITFANAQAERILGRPITLSADGTEAHEAVLVRAMAGELVEGEEVQYQRGDGSFVWIRLSGAPIPNPEGAIVGSVVVFYDIDRERIALDSLREREREVATLLNNVPDIISRYDRDLRCVLTGPSVERYTGLPPKYFVGKKNSELGLPPELTSAWDQTLRRIFQIGEWIGMSSPPRAQRVCGTSTRSACWSSGRTGRWRRCSPSPTILPSAS
jgi:PAS domain S-box-containing protein